MPYPDPTLRPSLSAALALVVATAMARLSAVPELAAGLADAGLAARVARVAVASDFALETLRRQPWLLAHLADDAAPPPPPPVLDPGASAEWARQLREYRAAASTRLVWRDVLGLDQVDDTLAGSTRLAEQCLRLALAAIEADHGHFVARHGHVHAADGTRQRLVVFGLGKLGGGELNFSSDVDLVYAYPQGGESDGPKPLAAEEYFARQGQRLARLLDEPTVDGFSHRVDLRLRPFGTAGRVALSFAGMDQYFQREGRDWERYAWLKARAVAGDLDAGEDWLQTLRPFVYRRYLDFTALDGLRTMKAAIAAEVARRELADDIKRGPGGIREIEFLVQALQLIRGGREAPLRERRLLPALRALLAAGHVAQADADTLGRAYRFLRRLENRLQMLRDAQVHALPDDAIDRERLAVGLGYAAWQALIVELQGHRDRVALEFGELLAPRTDAAVPGALDSYWRALPAEGDPAALANAGFGAHAAADTALREFAQSLGVRSLSDAARARLDRVMPALLHAVAASAQTDAALKRLLALLHAILRRASYLALLDEQPTALRRLVDVVGRSALLAERLALYPLLLDELLDTRVDGPLPGRDAMAAACETAMAIEDPESSLRALNETRLALSFRIALAALDGRQPPLDSARQLAQLAEAVVQRVLRLADAAVASAHGHVPGGHFVVVGYGSLGGGELGFGSDLDLVFLYEADADAQSDGARPLDAQRWYARLAQKVVALLGMATGGGRLYDIDVRLRPDGGKGLLVSSFASYREYQGERAWTWEHQALVRARPVAGDAAAIAAFEAIRTATLATPRDPVKLHADVVAMRRRMRSELDRSSGGQFDLKQGAGGLVDLEFLVQYGVLVNAASEPSVLVPRDTPALLDALCAAGWLSQTDAARLREAHGQLVGAGLACTLDRRPRIVAEAPLHDTRSTVDAVLLAHDLVFEGVGEGAGLRNRRDDAAR